MNEFCKNLIFFMDSSFVCLCGKLGLNLGSVYFGWFVFFFFLNVIIRVSLCLDLITWVSVISVKVIEFLSG